jgi:uncharacterized repeat protein (TIGR03806 family)
MTFQTAFPNVHVSWPVSLIQLPAAAGGDFVVAEQDGTVRRIENRADIGAADLVVDLSAQINANVPNGGSLARVWNWELGLMAVAFHPDFPSVPDFFVSYTLNTGTAAAPSWTLRLSRFQWFGTTLSANDAEVLLQIAMPGPIHHAGGLTFDPQGYLMMSVGDGDVGSNAQPLDRLLGKLLRLDVNGSDALRGTAYRIPADNPFAAGGGAPEIWASGFRNPWRFGFDRSSGQLWLGDVGDTRLEEVDLITRGGNYGWPVFEGSDCQDATGACDDPSLIQPLFTYFHDNYPHSGGGNAIVGGYVYHGSAIPDLQGTYVYADFDQGLIKVLRNVGGSYTTEIVGQLNWMISSLAEDVDGELFALPYGSGVNLQRIVQHAPSDTGPPALLSATGCIDAGNPHSPAPGTVPYAINVPSFADGASTARWFNVPTDSTVSIGNDDRWQFPIGSVIAQNLSRAGRLIETRLLMHHADGWAGYSYAWNQAQTDATLLTTGKTVSLTDGAWTFPARSDCMVCHNGIGGFALGLETGQLNRTVHYDSNGRTADQLSTLDGIGLFDRTLPANPPRLAPVDEPGAALEIRARSYLHANCSGCHRPDGPTGLDIDFRYGVPTAAMNVCGIAPQRGDLGLLGAERIAPGHPEQSVIRGRIAQVGAFQMPPLGRASVDANGLAVIDAWISSLSACPVAR